MYLHCITLPSESKLDCNCFCVGLIIFFLPFANSMPPAALPISANVTPVDDGALRTLSGSFVPMIYLECDSENKRSSDLLQEFGTASRSTLNPTEPAIAISARATARPPFEQS